MIRFLKSPKNSTMRTSKNGPSFVLKGKLINSPTCLLVLDFLTELYEKGFTYSAINTARSALSYFVQLDDGSSVGKNPLISRLLKGVFQCLAPKPKYRY